MSFALSRKTGSILFVAAAGKDLEWVFYVVERDGHRSWFPDHRE